MSKTEKEMVKEMFDDMYKVEPTFTQLNGVSKPKHYDIGIDTFTRMRANATFEEAMGFIRWNIDKYNTRAKGQDEEDYKKIEAYCKEAMWWFVNRRAKE